MLHSSIFRILDPGSPVKRDVKPDEFKYLQQDTQQAAIIEDLLRTKKIEEAGSTDKNKKQIAQHLADLRKRGVLQDVSSDHDAMRERDVAKFCVACKMTLPLQTSIAHQCSLPPLCACDPIAWLPGIRACLR